MFTCLKPSLYFAASSPPAVSPPGQHFPATEHVNIHHLHEEDTLGREISKWKTLLQIADTSMLT